MFQKLRACFRLVTVIVVVHMAMHANKAGMEAKFHTIGAAKEETNIADDTKIETEQITDQTKSDENVNNTYNKQSLAPNGIMLPLSSEVTAAPTDDYEICSTKRQITPLYSSDPGMNITLSDIQLVCPCTKFCTANSSFADVSSETDVPCCSACSCAENCADTLCCPDSQFHRKSRSVCQYNVHTLSEGLKKNEQKWSTGSAMSKIRMCLPEYEHSQLKEDCNVVDGNIGVDYHRPVSDGHTLYGNKYCAMCNNFTEYEDFITTFTCSEYLLLDPGMREMYLRSSNDDREILMEARYCFYSFKPTIKLEDIARTHVCQEKINIHTCNITGRWLVKDDKVLNACASYELPYTDWITVYRNVHCYLCNLGPDYRLVNTMCKRSYNYNLVLKFSFSSILAFHTKKIPVHGDSSNVITKKTRRTCNNPKSMFDPYKNYCREIYCPWLQRWEDGRCNRIYLGVQCLPKLLILRLTIDGDSSENKIDVSELLRHGGFVTQVVGQLQHEYYYKIANPVEIISETLYWNVSSENILTILSVFVWKSCVMNHILDSVTLDILNKHIKNDQYSEVKTNHDDNATTVVTIKVMIESIIPKYYSGMPWNEQMTELIHRNLSMHMQYQFVNESNGYAASIHIKKTLECEQVQLSQNEYQPVAGDIIEVAAIGIRLSSVYYETGNEPNTIRICTDDYVYSVTETLLENVWEEISVISSFICLSLSIMCLLVCIVTYLMFHTLRTLPGKINMLLCCSMVIAQTFQQFTIDVTHNVNVCIVCGMLIHFFWMASVAWMNVASFNMFRAFAFKWHSRVSENSSRIILIYTVYVILVASSAVSINIAVSVLILGESIGYGGRICYISSNTMIGYTFALPVGVVVVCNAAFLVSVICRIASSPTPRMYGQERHNIQVYVKLSSLTGVCWIFGFVWIWTKMQIFEYLFILANASQGLFIMLSFICNKQVYGLYLSCICTKEVPQLPANLQRNQS